MIWPRNTFYQRYIHNEDTNRLRMQAMIDDYLKKHVLVELVYFIKRDKKHFQENLQDFSRKMIKSFGHPDLIWNFFNMANEQKT